MLYRSFPLREKKNSRGDVARQLAAESISTPHGTVNYGMGSILSPQLTSVGTAQGRLLTRQIGRGRLVWQ